MKNFFEDTSILISTLDPDVKIIKISDIRQWSFPIRIDNKGKHEIEVIFVILNFWNNGELIQEFMELYDLTKIQITNILNRVSSDTEQGYVRIFCEETGIKLDKVDVSNDIEFIGKIVSTTVDDFKHLKNVGLTTLDSLLENNSPIRRHLKKYCIEINPSVHEFLYKGERLYIPSYNEDCRWCAYGDRQCRYSKQMYKNICCSYLKAISLLSTKLYSNNSEIEMFLIASENEMIGYSTVRYYPEIFVTIEKFVNDWFEDYLNIGYDWTEIKQYSYIITIPVK